MVHKCTFLYGKKYQKADIFQNSAKIGFLHPEGIPTLAAGPNLRKSYPFRLGAITKNVGSQSEAAVVYTLPRVIG